MNSKRFFLSPCSCYGHVSLTLLQQKNYGSLLYFGVDLATLINGKRVGCLATILNLHNSVTYAKLNVLFLEQSHFIRSMLQFRTKCHPAPNHDIYFMTLCFFANISIISSDQVRICFCCCSCILSEQIGENQKGK